MGCQSSSPIGPAYKRKSNHVRENKVPPVLPSPQRKETGLNSIDLEVILFYQESHASFVEFLAHEHQKQYLDFHIAAKEYNLLPPDSKPTTFQYIYEKFLSPGSIYNLDLSDELKAKIFTSHEFLSTGKTRKSSLTLDLNADNFVTAAQEEVLSHLIDLVKKFRRSDIFNRFMDKAIETLSTKEKTDANSINKRLILITENTLLARILSKLLVDEGIAVHHAMNFASATSQLMNHQYDVALIGIDASDSAGYKVANDISKLDHPPMAAAMIIRGNESTEEMASQSGFKLVMRVPFSVPDLVQAIL